MSCDLETPRQHRILRSAAARYRQLVIWRIVSAKRAETREQRLADLIKARQERRRL